MSENMRFENMLSFLVAKKKIRNQQQFAEEIHSDKATVSQIKNGKIKIPNIMFVNIEKTFPMISTEWLKSGEGEMLKNEPASPTMDSLMEMLRSQQRTIANLSETVRNLSEKK